MKKLIKRVRSTITGRFVKAEMAKLDPAGTVTETVRRKTVIERIKGLFTR